MNTQDTFSFRRMMMLLAFYRKQLILQVCVYAVISILTGLMLVLSCHESNFMLKLLWTPFLFTTLLIVAPLIFTTVNAPEMMTSLPASPKEKTIFKIGYTFVVMPIVLLLPALFIILPFRGEILSSRPDMAAFTELLSTLWRMFGAGEILTLLLYMSVCLFGVCKFVRHRTLYSLLSCFVLFIALRIIASIRMVYVAARIYGQEGATYWSVNDNTEFFTDILNFLNAHSSLIGSMSVYGICEIIVLIAIIALLIRATFRTIENRQI